METNFTQCSIDWFQMNETYRSSHTYNGSIKGVVRDLDRPFTTTVQTCKELCGRGIAYYQPIDIMNTVATWILPVMGLLLQAPYESNQFKRTIKAILRRLGSPISSITCVLWNIKVLDKCALLADLAMASSVSEDPNSPFAKIRDSLYILSVMNQFQIHYILPKDSAAEVLVKIALFSNSLRMVQKRSTLPIRSEGELTLPMLRENLASELRSRRRHGSVPVFISLLWFLAALVFSIYFAFGNLGERATALNLAMGLTLSWMPVFILACIVDRNPYGTERIRKLLNEFIAHVAESVRRHPHSYLVEWQLEDFRSDGLRNIHARLQEDEDDLKIFNEFFTGYAGQGRTRWHYGVAHSVLVDIEHSVASSSSRGWFSGNETVRDKIIRGPTQGSTDFHHFSARELVQAAYAILIVEGTLAGAFTLAYCTPTYGLGCRSGGFMIFMILTFFSFLLELAFWWDIDRQYRSADPSKLTRLSKSIVAYREHVFMGLDFIVTVWLFYMILAQTVGTWETCDCVGSTWGRFVHGPGGYIDFLTVVQYKAQSITFYWGFGTATSMGVMFGAMIHVIIEWCTQSHLSTEDYGKALKGLKRTRWWKYCWFWFFRIVLYPIVVFLWPCCQAVWRFACNALTRRPQSAPRIRSNRISWEPVIQDDAVGDSDSYPLTSMAATMASDLS